MEYYLKDLTHKSSNVLHSQDEVTLTYSKSLSDNKFLTEPVIPSVANNDYKLNSDRNQTISDSECCPLESSDFLLLSVAMRMLLCPQLVTIYAESAHTLLTLFIQHTSALFGPEVVTYNLHGLSHLCSDAKQYGALDNISCFPFEKCSFTTSSSQIVRTSFIAIKKTNY